MNEDFNLEKPIFIELKEKYNLIKIISTRYNNDPELINFYETYHKEINKLEEIGLQIWTIFGNIWSEEKQDLILQLLSLTLFIEKQTLYMKKLVINIYNKKKYTHTASERDFNLLLSMLNKYKNNSLLKLDINYSLEDVKKRYNEGRTELKKTIESEYQKLISEPID